MADEKQRNNRGLQKISVFSFFEISQIPFFFFDCFCDPNTYVTKNGSSCRLNVSTFIHHYISRSRNNKNFVIPPWSYVPKVNIKFFGRSIRIWQNSKDTFGSITGWKDTTTSAPLKLLFEVLSIFLWLRTFSFATQLETEIVAMRLKVGELKEKAPICIRKYFSSSSFTL